VRVLVVVPFPLDPEGSAASRCMLGLIRGLVLHGIEVRALTVDARTSYVPPPPSDLPAESAYVEYPGRWRARLDRVVAPYGAFARGEFGKRLAALASDADLVHMHGIASAAMLPLISAPALVQLDCVTRRDRDIGPLWTREGRISLETLRAERRTCRRARWLLASSEEVASELAREAPHARSHHAPLSLDPAYYPGRAALTDGAVGLIGTARWPPTANAVQRLLTRVWPLVRERRPAARLLLAGSGMEREAFAHLPSPAGVEWLGRVPSADAFLTGLGALLYPVQRGSGAKVKVLESMLLGVPVVTTTPGAEGIDGSGGIVVADDDRALADATCELIDDVAARRSAAEQARLRFDAHHTPAMATVPVLDVYERILAVAPSRR
jgi:glycosyltransferase involved in cell wall biosynthesis